jgi:predicted nucleotide-binding protein
LRGRGDGDVSENWERGNEMIKLNKMCEDALIAVLGVYDGNDKLSVNGGYDVFPEYMRLSLMQTFRTLESVGLIAGYSPHLGSWGCYLTPDGLSYFEDKEAENNQSMNANAEKGNAVQSNKVFIVHGHDDIAKEQVEHFIRKVSLEPIIIGNEASGGRTIIEKIEEYSDDIGFGIAIYTPCDETAEGRFRARQNVVLEHGYLMGKLGREKVCALVKGEVEKPSDISGIVYISMNEKPAWEIALIKELKKAGYDVDANKIL